MNGKSLLKVAIVMPHSSRGAGSGDRARTRALSDELRALGHSVVIVAPSWHLGRGELRFEDDEYLVGQGLTGFSRLLWRAWLAVRRSCDPNALHHSRYLRRSLGECVALLGADVVDLQHSYWRLPNVGSLVVTVHNVLANPDFDGRSILPRRVRKAYESAALRSGDVIVVFSPQERDRLVTAHPLLDRSVAVVEIGHPSMAMAQNLDSTLTHALFVGSMDYEPNRSAAKRLLRLWNSDNGALPPLSIVGRRASVLGDGDNPNVKIVSDAADLTSYYRNAIAALMPLSHGGGVRLKALEAMAWGVPIIGTSLAVEGLGLVDNESYLEIASEIEVPLALRRLRTDNELRQRLVGKAADRWKAIGSPQSMASKMVECYREAIRISS